MRRREKVVLLSALVLVVSCLSLTGGRGTTSAQVPPLSTKAHFLEVGNIYTIEPLGRDGINCKIIEIPRSNWVKVRVEKDQRILWLNLDQMAVIEAQDQPVK
jgi:hypothetical protein